MMHSWIVYHSCLFSSVSNFAAMQNDIRLTSTPEGHHCMIRCLAFDPHRQSHKAI